MRIKIKTQTNLNDLFRARILLFISAILLGFNCVWAQEKEIKFDIPVHNPFGNYKKLPAHIDTEVKEPSAKEIEPAPNAAVPLAEEAKQEKALFAPVKDEIKWLALEKDVDEKNIKDTKNARGQVNFSQTKTEEKFHWKPALIQSGIFLGLQHGFRMTQEKTRRELGGPFFRDWARSVKNLRGWEDGDNSFTNYVAHPLQGSLTGRIFINNSERSKKQEFGKSKKYWESRFKALVWSAVWSTQFELGPVSEATIGNVGTREKRGRSTMAWADLVMTPVAGTGLLIGEDAIDKYVLKNWLERKNGNKVSTKIKIFRSFLTPTTSVSNLLRWKKPWKRDNR